MSMTTLRRPLASSLTSLLLDALLPLLLLLASLSLTTTPSFPSFCHGTTPVSQRVLSLQLTSADVNDAIGASAIAYATIVSSIFAARYLDVLRWGLKTSWMVLGVTILAEVLGKVVLNNGLATQVRPRRYYTVPRETLDALIGDVHELINFFVIEAQRIIFAENVAASAAVSFEPTSASKYVILTVNRPSSLLSSLTILSSLFLSGDLPSLVLPSPSSCP